MSTGKLTALVASAALVFGLVLGAVGIAAAEPSTDSADDRTVERPFGRAGGPMVGQMDREGSRENGTSLIEVAAELTGLSADDLVTELQDEGKSVAALAAEHGVSTEDLVDGLYAAHKAALDTRVADGLITQEQADWALENLAERAEDMVLSAGMHGPGFGLGRGPRGGMGGPGACFDAPVEDAAPTS